MTPLPSPRLVRSTCQRCGKQFTSADRIVERGGRIVHERCHADPPPLAKVPR